MSTVTIVATVEADNVPPRVRLDVTDVGTPNLFAVTVTRLDPDGSAVPVRTSDGNPLVLTTSGVTRVGLLYDYEMPFGSIVSYSTAEDPSTISGEVSVSVDQPWLVHPGVPALSLPIDLRIGSFDEETVPVKQGVFYPMGRQTPVVVSDGVRHSGQSSFTVATATLAELDAIRALISDAGILLFNVSPLLGIGVDPNYIAVSDVTISRPSSIGTDLFRDVRIPFTIVDRPAGGSTAQRTYIDLLAYPTYAALQAAYPSYLDLLAGP